MPELYQIKVQLLGILQEKSLTVKKILKVNPHSTFKVWYLVIKCLRDVLSFLSLDYTGKGLSSSSESKEDESLEYNEAVQVFIFTVLSCRGQ